MQALKLLPVRRAKDISAGDEVHLYVISYWLQEFTTEAPGSQESIENIC